MAEHEDTKPEAPKGTSPLILGLLVLNMAIGAFVAVKVLSMPKPQPASPPQNAGEAGGARYGGFASRVPGPMFEMEPFVVNLNEPGKPRYLKANFGVELENAEAKTALETRKPAVRDEVLRYLSSLTVADTAGEKGKARVAGEVRARVDKMVGGGRIRQVYFLDFVIQ
jgi:flagellar FliL protein